MKEWSQGCEMVLLHVCHSEIAIACDLANSSILIFRRAHLTAEQRHKSALAASIDAQDRPALTLANGQVEPMDEGARKVAYCHRVLNQCDDRRCGAHKSGEWPRAGTISRTACCGNALHIHPYPSSSSPGQRPAQHPRRPHLEPHRETPTAPLEVGRSNRGPDVFFSGRSEVQQGA